MRRTIQANSGLASASVRGSSSFRAVGVPVEVGRLVRVPAGLGVELEQLPQPVLAAHEVRGDLDGLVVLPVIRVPEAI